MTERADAAPGFTLVEVLIALVILAIAAGLAFSTVSGSVAWLAQASMEQQAVSSAQTALSRLGHDIAVHPGRTTGVDGDLRWTVDVGAALTDPMPAEGLAAYPVTVTIESHSGEAMRPFRLQSVKLGPEGSS